MLAIAATDDEPLNATVSQHANALGVPVNVVDSPQLCGVIFPAIVDRSPLVVAVSSGGDAPVLARLIRARIETDPGSLRSAGRAGKTVSCRSRPVRQRAATAGVLGGCFRGLSPSRRWPGAEAERLLAEKLAGAAPGAGRGLSGRCRSR